MLLREGGRAIASAPEAIPSRVGHGYRERRSGETNRSGEVGHVNQLALRYCLAAVVGQSVVLGQSRASLELQATAMSSMSTTIDLQPNRPGAS